MTTWKNALILILGIAFGVLTARLTAPRQDWVSPSEFEIFRAQIEQSRRSERAGEVAAHVRTVVTVPDAGSERSPELERASSTSSTDTVEAAPLSPEQQDAVALADGVSEVERVENLMRSAPADSSNVARIRRAIHDYRVAHPGSSELQAVRCTAAWCELELWHSDPSASQRMLIDMMAIPGFSGAGVFIRRQTDDGYRTTLVVSQDESTLP